MEKAWSMAPMDKKRWPQWNIPSQFMNPMEKVSFYEILFFQMVIVMVKDKKRCTIKDKMSIKISFIRYRNYITWTRVKLPVVFEEFDLVYVFWLRFSFHYHCQLVKDQLKQKSGGGGWAAASPSPSVSTGLNMTLKMLKDKIKKRKAWSVDKTNNL